MKGEGEKYEGRGVRYERGVVRVEVEEVRDVL